MTPRVSATVAIAKPALERVFENLRQGGLRLIGPVVRRRAIVLDEISSTSELPVGWTDEQSPGRYRLRDRKDGSWFGYNVGPHTWKRYLYPPREKLFTVVRDNGDFRVEPASEPADRCAFIGVRACELNAIAIQDRVFMNGPYAAPRYAARRETAFILAVNCSQAGANCFCTSMKTGPKVGPGFDLALTELPDSFIIEVGSEAGSEAMIETGWKPATAFELGRAQQVVHETERQITRELSTDDLPSMLYENLEHDEWKNVAARCLGCSNCTMVCPTCFCSTVEDTIDLTFSTDRVRVWDSCYTSDFSHVHGGNLRPTLRSRYRQWLTHKFASWKEQYGVFGCVGCGRCTTWCPVGIEVTEEVKALREGGGR